MSSSGGISIHAFDVANGRPAVDLAVQIVRCDGDAEILIAEGRCSASGELDHPCATGEGVIAGIYIARFDLREFFEQSGLKLPDPAFLDVVHYHFGIAEASQHYHLPFKFTPWGYSLFRGGL